MPKQTLKKTLYKQVNITKSTSQNIIHNFYNFNQFKKTKTKIEYTKK